MLIDHSYIPSLWGMATMGLMILVQLIIADISSIKSKHMPGAPITADPKTFVFRASRAHANTNETIACFILFTVVALLCKANPLWLNSFVWLFVACRSAHMIFYYTNQSTMRSISFGFSLAALIGLCSICVVGLL